MNLNRENCRIAIALLTIAVVFLFVAKVAAQSQKGEVAVQGREVTILVTAHPHDDRAREIALGNPVLAAGAVRACP